MQSPQSSADSYICHVTDALQQRHARGNVDDLVLSANAPHFPPPSESVPHRYSSPHAAVKKNTNGCNRDVEERYAYEPSVFYASSALRVQRSEASDCHGGAVTAASQPAAESDTPSSQVPASSTSDASQQLKSLGNYTKNKTNQHANFNRYSNHCKLTPLHTGVGAADPFISVSSAEASADDVASHVHTSSLTLNGVPMTKVPANQKSTIHAMELPLRGLPQPQVDRVCGNSVAQEPAAALLQRRSVSDSVWWMPPIAHTAQLHSSRAGSGSRQTQQQRYSSTPAIASNCPVYNNGGSAALVPARAPDASSIIMCTCDSSMKELVSHVNHDSYGFDLRDALQAIDFPVVLDEYRQNSSIESKALQECRHVFRVLAKNKDAMSAEDVYDLLVLFTPCGAARREGIDFLWENCEGKSSLSFENFLLYGPRLCARLRGFELFIQLSDQEKLLVTHHRVLPGEPFADANAARMHLLQLADEQLQGTMRPQTRPLRLYEELFLVEYQEMLYEAALIPASEIPRRVPDGDFAHEHLQHYTLPQLSVPVLQRENTDWRVDGGEDEDRFCAASFGSADRPQHVVACEVGESSNQVSPVHRDANQSGRRLQPTRPHGIVNGHGLSHTAKKCALTACYSLYHPDGSRSARYEESLAVTLQGRPRPDMRKNLGRFVEEEYWERRTLDDHLITQLQNMYSTR